MAAAKNVQMAAAMKCENGHIYEISPLILITCLPLDILTSEMKVNVCKRFPLKSSNYLLPRANAINKCRRNCKQYTVELEIFART